MAAKYINTVKLMDGSTPADLRVCRAITVWSRHETPDVDSQLHRSKTQALMGFAKAYRIKKGVPWYDNDFCKLICKLLVAAVEDARDGRGKDTVRVDKILNFILEPLQISEGQRRQLVKDMRPSIDRRGEISPPIPDDFAYTSLDDAPPPKSKNDKKPTTLEDAMREATKDW